MSLSIENVNKSQFERDGYLIIDLLDSEQVDLINDEIEEAQKKEDFNIKKNPSIYHYNDSPRFIEAWKWSENIKNVCLDERLERILFSVWGAVPIPFSTINFLKGSEQPLHSDAFHFGSEPDGGLAGVWIALEDIKPGSGELVIVPGSHKYPYVDCGDLGLNFPKSKNELKENNTAYENYVANLILSKKSEKKNIIIKKGQALIWAANLLHGSSAILDKALTRKSMVIHFHFEGCEYFFNPNFSNRKEGKIALRNVKELDIRNIEKQ